MAKANQTFSTGRLVHVFDELLAGQEWYDGQLPDVYLSREDFTFCNQILFDLIRQPDKVLDLMRRTPKEALAPWFNPVSREQMAQHDQMDLDRDGDYDRSQHAEPSPPLVAIPSQDELARSMSIRVDLYKDHLVFVPMLKAVDPNRDDDHNSEQKAMEIVEVPTREPSSSLQSVMGSFITDAIKLTDSAISSVTAQSTDNNHKQEPNADNNSDQGLRVRQLINKVAQAPLQRFQIINEKGTVVGLFSDRIEKGQIRAFSILNPQGVVLKESFTVGHHDISMEKLMLTDEEVQAEGDKTESGDPERDSFLSRRRFAQHGPLLKYRIVNEAHTEVGQFADHIKGGQIRTFSIFNQKNFFEDQFCISVD